jgi:predicted N-acetyltransferase YhbS
LDYHPILSLSIAPKYDIRLYEEGDVTKVVRLLEDVFDGWPNHDVKSGSLEHWRWKHLDNPLGRSLVLVTESGGEIVASNHSCLLRAKVDEAPRLGVVASDLAVDSSHRRKGIRNAMMVKKHEHLERMGVEFTLAATGNPIVIESMLRWKRPRFPHPVASTRASETSIYISRRCRRRMPG